jgi:hypothetical protein
MAERNGGWCAQESAHFINRSGNRYCNFHAPKEGKRGSAEEFNNKVFKLIDAAIAGGKKCNLSGTVFPWPVIFSQYGKDKPLPPIDLSRVTFEDQTVFTGAIFSGTASFTGATFKGQTAFIGTDFGGNVSFGNATFSGETNFRNAIFGNEKAYDHTEFFSATFGDHTIFVDTIFNNVTLFGDATFNGETYFNHATFKRETHFRSATFGRASNFQRSTFKHEADFRDVTFAGTTFFKDVTFNGKTYFDDATFNGKIYIMRTEFSGDETSFTFAEFNNKAIFASNTTKEGFDNAVQFHDMRTGKEAKVFFEDMDFSAFRCSFLRTNLSNFCFNQCDWLREKYSGSFSSLINKILLTPDDNVAFYDEILTQEGVDVDFFPMRKLSTAQQRKRFEMIEDLYRQMKVKSKEAHNEPETSRWHYREKEMFRKKNRLRRFNPLSATSLYWFFSGYGERPIRAGFVLLLLFVAIGLAMNGLGLHAETYGKASEIIQGFSLSPDLQRIGKVTQAVIEHALFVKDPTLKAQPGWGGVLFTIWTKVLIPIQAALFAFALRNKFRR